MEKASFFISRNALPSSPNCFLLQIMHFPLTLLSASLAGNRVCKIHLSTASLKDKQGQEIFFSCFFLFLQKFLQGIVGTNRKSGNWKWKELNKYISSLFPIRALALEFPKCENHSIGFYSRCSKKNHQKCWTKHGKSIIGIAAVF